MNVYLRNLLALYVFIHFFIYSYFYLMICLVLTRLFVCLYLSIYLFSYLFISQFTCMTIPNIRIYEYTIISTCLVKKFYFFDTIQCLRLHDRPRINTMHPISQRDFLPTNNLHFNHIWHLKTYLFTVFWQGQHSNKDWVEDVKEKYISSWHVRYSDYTSRRNCKD